MIATGVRRPRGDELVARGLRLLVLDVGLTGAEGIGHVDSVGWLGACQKKKVGLKNLGVWSTNVFPRWKVMGFLSGAAVDIPKFGFVLSLQLETLV